MNTPTKGCPFCSYPYYDMQLAYAEARMHGDTLRYIHSADYGPDSPCVCQGCEKTFMFGNLKDITAEDLDNEAA